MNTALPSHRRTVLVLSLLLAGILQLGSAISAHAATVYVAPGGAGTRDGSSWGNAKDLVPALTDAAYGDELWVKSGIYKPTGPGGDRKATFALKSGVALYGGFAGSETELSQRNSNPALNETVLSGDLNGNDSSFFVNGNDIGFTNSGENSYHVVTGSGTDESAILDGFTVSGGNANTQYVFPDDIGGGMLNLAGNPRVSNVIFRGNYAMYGAGVYNGSTASGGGSANITSSPTLTNVAFIGNVARILGGGMSNRSYTYGNSGISRCNPTLTNVSFSGNLGGALDNVSFSSSRSISNGSSTSDPVLTNVTFSGNAARIRGGGIFNLGSSDYGTASAAPTLRNCVLWGNSGGEIVEDGSGSTPVATNCLIQGGYPGGSNIIDLDPKFVAPITGMAPTTTGNLHLRYGSLAIDAGNSVVADPALPSTDLDGRARVIGAEVDLGAYEYHPEDFIPPARLTLSGSGGFGLVDVGRTSRVRRITVRNVGGEEANGLTVGLARPGSREFLIGAPATTVLEPGGSTTFRVRFRPSGGGQRSAVVEVLATGVSAVSMRLAGQGVSNIPKPPEGPNPPRATTPSSP